MATIAAQKQQDLINKGYSAYQVELASNAYNTGGDAAMQKTLTGFGSVTAPKTAPTSPYTSSTGATLGTTPVPTKTTAAPVPVVQAGQTVPTRSTQVVSGVTNQQGAWNPYTNSYETVNPTVGINQGAYSPDQKQSLWQQSGQTGNYNTDAFYRKTDGTLGIKPEFVKATNPGGMTDVSTVNAYLGGVQNNDFIGNGGTQAATDYVQLAKQISEAMGSKAPDNFNRAQTLSDLRSQYGVTDLESQLMELDKQANDLAAVNRQRVAAEEGKPVAMGVIGGRVSEIERQDNERLDAVNRQRSYVSSQLQVKNSLIDQTMKAKSEDYATASARYDAEFSKNLQMLQLARGINQDQMTEKDRQEDNARATINTIYNTVTSGGLNPNTMSDSQKANIGRMEMQAGLPPGFITNLYDKNPKGDIIYSGKETLADGNDYVTIIMKDKVTGETSTQKILVGKSADQANKDAELKIKQQQANTAAAKKKTTSSGGTSSSSNTKTEAALASDVSAEIKEIATGKVDFDTAHAIIYAKYNAYLKAQGYSDAQIKQAIHTALGGK